MHNVSIPNSGVVSLFKCFHKHLKMATESGVETDKIILLKKMFNLCGFDRTSLLINQLTRPRI